MGMGTFDVEYGQHGFTPVRRPQSTINTRLLNGEPEKEWTATRCNRLLRALTSRVSLLKKDLSHIQNGAAALDGHTKATEKRKRVQDFDEDWSKGNHTRKRVKRKYSGRQGKAGTVCGAPSQACSQKKCDSRFVAGEIAVPTPFLNRRIGTIVTTNAAPAIPFLKDHTQEDNMDSGLKTKRRYRKDELARYQHQYNTYMYELKKKNVSTSLSSIYEGIYNGLESLLKATTDSTKLKSTGAMDAGSLFAMCLRAVPQCISEEEKKVENQLAEAGKGRTIDSRDVSSEIYDDLESLGTSGRGWKHLKTVVRSHGVEVVRKAIATGLLDIGFCSVLIKLCFQTQAISEGETLLSALLVHRSFPPPQSIFTHAYQNNATIPLSLLWYVALPGISSSFRYQQLSCMIVDERLPLSWLATKDFSPVWTKAIQELSSQTTNAEILHFLVVALERLATEPGRGSEPQHALFEALNQTFSSILTTISSIVILSRETEHHAQHTYLKPELIKYDHIIRLLRSCLIEWELSDSCNTHGCLLLLANISVGSFSDDTHSELGLARHLLKELRVHRGLVTGDLVALICSIASCCGRGTYTKGFRHLKQLHSILESLALARDPNGRNELHELIVDSSFAFAQQAPSSEHLQYATSTEAEFHVVKTKQVAGETPTKSGGFRWEEGISEWVSATPAVNKSGICIGLRNTSPDCASSICTIPMQDQVKRSNSNNRVLSTITSPQLKSRATNYSHGSPISSPSTDIDEDEVSIRSDESPNSSFATTISSFSESIASTSCRQKCRTLSFNSKVTKKFSQKSKIFNDESDDELSFCDTSSHEEHALQDITNAVRLNKQRPSIEDFGKDQKNQRKMIRKTSIKVLDDSEDELGI